MKKNQKFLVAGIIIIVAIASLVYVGIKESGVYYMTIAELKSRAAEVTGQGIRVSGSVMADSIEEITKELILKFRVKDEDGDDNTFINVFYKGVKPDSFKEDVQVILEGKYNMSENLMKATTLLVKCPSRYEGEVPPEDHDYSSGKKEVKEIGELKDMGELKEETVAN